jgi:hypothetical protein
MEEIILERLSRLEERVSALESRRVTASTNTANLLREMNALIGNTRPTRVNTIRNANLRKTFRKVAKPINNHNYKPPSLYNRIKLSPKVTFTGRSYENFRDGKFTMLEEIAIGGHGYYLDKNGKLYRSLPGNEFMSVGRDEVNRLLGREY